MLWRGPHKQLLMLNEHHLKGIPRGFEICMALIGLVLAAPILAIFAILIIRNSSGPIFFRQKRVGINGKEFTLFKLRTMAAAKTGPLVTAAGDYRITPVGRILRKTKIDELPELWNVLRGDMSFVGPRPEVPEFVDIDDPLWQRILEHKPGITDPVTLRLRNEEKLLAGVVDKELYYREVLQPYKLRGYLRFIENKSWKTDIRIIGRTLKAVALPKSVKTPSREELRWSYSD